LTCKQSCSDLWHQERKFRISASIMKSVCHKRKDTSSTSFITNKLCPKAINIAAINYGRVHEDVAIKSYVKYKQKRGLRINVHRCGLHIRPAIPWLAAIPDSLVEIGGDWGCLEVKCPYACKTKQIAMAASANLFCLQMSNGVLSLKKKHQYFYQVQSQLFVTSLNGTTSLLGPQIMRFM